MECIGSIEYRGESLKIFETCYNNNGNTAVVIQDEEGSPYAILSVNTAELLEKGEFAVKDYNTTKDFIETLRLSGIFEETDQSIKLQYSRVPVWKVKKFEELDDEIPF